MISNSSYQFIFSLCGDASATIAVDINMDRIVGISWCQDTILGIGQDRGQRCKTVPRWPDVSLEHDHSRISRLKDVATTWQCSPIVLVTEVIHAYVVRTIQTPNGRFVFRQQIIGILRNSKAGSSV